MEAEQEAGTAPVEKGRVEVVAWAQEREEEAKALVASAEAERVRETEARVAAVTKVASREVSVAALEAQAALAEEAMGL